MTCAASIDLLIKMHFAAGIIFTAVIPTLDSDWTKGGFVMQHHKAGQYARNRIISLSAEERYLLIFWLSNHFGGDLSTGKINSKFAAQKEIANMKGNNSSHGLKDIQNLVLLDAAATSYRGQNNVCRTKGTVQLHLYIKGRPLTVYFRVLCKYCCI